MVKYCNTIEFNLNKSNETNEIVIYLQICHILLSSLLIQKEIFHGLLA